MTTTIGPPAFTFRGGVSQDPDLLTAAAADAVILTTDTVANTPLLKQACSAARVMITVSGRPDASTLVELTHAARDTAANRILGVGDGSVLDAAKLAAHNHATDGGGPMPTVLVPVAREWYRAMTPFAVVDHEGQRPTVVDQALAAADVLVISELLTTVDATTVALGACDTAVIATESMLSTNSTIFSRILATAALDALVSSIEAAVSETDGEVKANARATLVLGSLLAAEAMWATKLGLAHAIASPLGTVTGLTHDVIHSVLGTLAVRLWGDGTAGMAAAARAMRVPATSNSVSTFLDGLRQRAGLPPSLRELGIDWESVERALPMAANSSGLPALPVPMDGDSLRTFAANAWRRTDV